MRKAETVLEHSQRNYALVVVDQASYISGLFST